MTRLNAAGFAEAAIVDKALAQAAANHNCVFFAERNTHGEIIDHTVVFGGLLLVPDDGALANSPPILFLDEAEPFETMLEYHAIYVVANIPNASVRVHFLAGADTQHGKMT